MSLEFNFSYSQHSSFLAGEMFVFLGRFHDDGQNDPCALIDQPNLISVLRLIFPTVQKINRIINHNTEMKFG